jgi:hypothetical protein
MVRPGGIEPRAFFTSKVRRKNVKNCQAVAFGRNMCGNLCVPTVLACVRVNFKVRPLPP